MSALPLFSYGVALMIHSCHCGIPLLHTLSIIIKIESRYRYLSADYGMNRRSSVPDHQDEFSLWKQFGQVFRGLQCEGIFVA